MARTLILFNLKPGVSVSDYERWALDQEIPTVNGLRSVDKFEAYRAIGMMFSDEPSPYAYAEILDISDDTTFGHEIEVGKMKKVAENFGAMVENPIFINLEKLQ